VNGLQQAIQARHPGAILADQTAQHAFVGLAGKRGLHRIGFAVMPGGRIRLGRPEAMRPAALPRLNRGTGDRIAALKGQIAGIERAIAALAPARPARARAPAAGDDFAPCAVNPRWQRPRATPWTNWPTEDGPPLPRAMFDAPPEPAPASDGDDFAPVLRSSWGRS
jgi:hypothetical protein